MKVQPKTRRRNRAVGSPNEAARNPTPRLVRRPSARSRRTRQRGLLRCGTALCHCRSGGCHDTDRHKARGKGAPRSTWHGPRSALAVGAIVRRWRPPGTPPRLVETPPSRASRSSRQSRVHCLCRGSRSAAPVVTDVSHDQVSIRRRSCPQHPVASREPHPLNGATYTLVCVFLSLDSIDRKHAST